MVGTVPTSTTDPLAESGAARPGRPPAEDVVARLALLAVTGAAVAAAALGASPPVSLIIPVFVLTCPGIALLRLVRLGDPLLELVAGVALSASAAGLISVLQAYLHAWSPSLLFMILVGVTGGALLVEVGQEVRRAAGPAVAWVAMRDVLRRPSGRASAVADDARRLEPPGGSEGRSAGTDAPTGGMARETPDLPPPPPVAVVRPSQAPPPTPTREKGRRRVLAYDPLEDPTRTRSLRGAIERVVDDLADEKDGSAP